MMCSWTGAPAPGPAKRRFGWAVAAGRQVHAALLGILTTLCVVQARTWNWPSVSVGDSVMYLRGATDCNGMAVQLFSRTA